MSTEAKNSIRSIQTLVGSQPDGIWGPKSQAALDALVARADAPQVLPDPELDTDDQAPVDARSEAAIETLHPRVRPLARALVNRALTANIKAVITSGTRTYEEQDALYEQGRSRPGNIVTNARAGRSNHNFGVAFDVTVFNGKTPVWEGAEYVRLGSIGKSLGLDWGGDWESIKDEPHFELHPAWAKDMGESEMLAQLRERHASGTDAFA